MNCRLLLISLFLTLAVCADANLVIKEVIRTQETCNSSNGTITIIVEGDTTGVLYSIDNGLTFQSSNYFDGLESSDYVISATKGLFCTDYYTEQITDIGLPSVNISVECEPGYDLLNIDLTPPLGSGLPPYTYEWIGPNGNNITDEDLTQVEPGTYSVIVRDRDGCTGDTTFVVSSCCNFEITSEAIDAVVDCGSDYGSLFEEFVQSIGGAEFSSTHAELKITSRPEVVDIDFDCIGLETPITFLVEDNCGNIDSTSASFLVVDQQKPQIDCPLDATIDLSSQDLAEIESWLSEISVKDNCGIPLVSNNFDPSLVLTSCSKQTIPISIEAIDDCGNSETCQTNILVQGNSPPIISCPDNLLIKCQTDDFTPVIQDWLESASGSDTYNPILKPTNNFDFNLIGSFSCRTQGQQVTFELTNLCGKATCNSVIKLLDEESPELICPQDLQVDLGESSYTQTLDAWLESIAVSDNCSQPTVVNNLKMNLTELRCHEEIEVVFTATDLCDNVATCMSLLTVKHDNYMLLDCPENLYISCRNVVPDSLDYRLLKQIEVESSLPYELVYDYEVDLAEISCDFIYTFGAEVSLIDDCSNRQDCQIQLHVEPEAKVYISNVFAPNISNQGQFTVYTNPVITEVEQFHIYNKWGQLVYEEYGFEPNDESKGWDGRYEADRDDGGVYVYYVTLKSVTGKEYEYKGEITLLK